MHHRTLLNRQNYVVAFAFIAVLLFVWGQAVNAHMPGAPQKKRQILNPPSSKLTSVISGQPVQSASLLAAAVTDPSQVGQWTAPFPWPVVAIHMALLPTGQILSFDGPPEDGGASAILWNPATGIFSPVPNNFTNLFCVGQAPLADGRHMFAGGHDAPGVGLRDANLYDPVTREWTLAAPMSFPRWYPTVLTLSDGRLLVISGSDTCEECFVRTPEIYNPRTNTWTSLTGANLSLPLYPHMYVLPDGRILEAGSVEEPVTTRVLNLSTQTWTVVDPNVVDGHSGLMYRPGLIMKSGTAADVGSAGFAADTTYVLDMTKPTPRWRSTAPMAFPRAFHNLTILPDGNVLATGGGFTADGIDSANAVFAAELWSPATEIWTTMASMQTPRLYHGNALLLPDGRVLVAGSGRYGPEPQFSAEIYSPPYLFKGPRPTIGSAPASAIYGQSIFVGTSDGAQISSVSLIGLGSATHAFNTGQHFVNLGFTQTSGGLNIQMPANGNLASPGYYMLFLVNGAGVPSVGHVVLIGEDSDGDGLPDAWEFSYFGNLGHDGIEDADSDGLTNAQELAVGTSPLLADSDGDGFSDSEELAAGSNPLDSASIPPGIVVTPFTLSFSGQVGGASPPSQTINVTDTNQRILSWTATPDQAWLSVNPTSGNTPGSFTVSVSTAGLAVGTYNGTITITSPQAENSPWTLPVNFGVGPPGPTGLVAAYGFSEGFNTTVADSSGNPNIGTLTNGPVWTTQGKYGNAITFDGVNDFVSVADNVTLDLAGTGTIETWVRLNAINRWHGVIAKGNANSSAVHNYGIEITDTNRVRCIFGNGAAFQEFDSTITIAANQFRHLACTWNGTTLSLYIDGVLNNSTAQTITPAGNTSPLYIGQFGGNSDRLNGIDR